MEIFTNFSHVVGKFVVTKKCTVMVVCLSVSLLNAGVEERLIKDQFGQR